MKKSGWDGRFDSPECKYKYTGNIVNDVIENGGRILHEQTSDGFTHELTDRGEYVSDDYYFPQRDPAKSRAHIHYEIRSTGEILVDGKPIVQTINSGGVPMLKGRQLGRNKSLDSTILKKESGDQVQEGDRLHELGTKFESDKGKLENEIEKVKNSKISEADKRKLVAQLEGAIVALQEQYDREVTEEEERQQQELMGQIDAMQEAADELERQSADLRALKMEAASTDAAAAADAADDQKRAFEEMKKEYVDKLNLQMQQAEIQRRNIRNRRLSGR